MRQIFTLHLNCFLLRGNALSLRLKLFRLNKKT